MLHRRMTEKGIREREEKRERMELRHALFEKHWNSKPHICESCGKKLYGDNKSYYHDHILERAKRPDLELEMGNLFMICQECHSMKTNGFPTERHKIAIEEAKKRYE